MWHYRPYGPCIWSGMRGRLSTILLNLPSLRPRLMDRTADKIFTIPYWVVTVVLLVVATVVITRISPDSSVAFSWPRIGLNAGFLLLFAAWHGLWARRRRNWNRVRASAYWLPFYSGIALSAAVFPLSLLVAESLSPHPGVGLLLYVALTAAFAGLWLFWHGISARKGMAAVDSHT